MSLLQSRDGSRIPHIRRPLHCMERERHEPGLVSRNDRNSGVQLARKTLGAAVVENAYCCAACRKIVIDYSL